MLSAASATNAASEDAAQELSRLREIFKAKGKVTCEDFIKCINNLRESGRMFVKDHEGFGRKAVEKLRQQFSPILQRMACQ